MNNNAFHRAREAEGAVTAAPAGPGDGSLWRITAPRFAGGETAAGTLATDVAVVGAGVAGLSTALHLHERNIETVVLEADQPGSAATGASGGILAPDFSRNGIARAARLHGRRQAEDLTRLVGGSAAFTFDLISRYGIVCDAVQSGFVAPGQTAHEIESLRSDCEIWRSLGFAVNLLDERETADAIGTRIYRGALCFETGGALNPLAYATGMANVLHDAGVPVFSNSPVLGMERNGNGWLLSLGTGHVQAKRVVLAANGGNSALHPALRNATMPLLVYEYATPPLSAGDRRHYLGRGLPYTDRRAYVFTGRLDPDGRLISAIPEVIPGWSESRFVREACRRIGNVYSMRIASIEFSWRGSAHLNSSLLPAVYMPENDLTLLAIQACNGRGLGINTIVGSQVAGLLADGDRDAMATPLLRPKAIPTHFLASRAPRIVMSLARLADRLRRK